MKNKSIMKPIFFGILSLIALFAFAKQEKVIQIFKGGEVIQEYAVSDIDYIEVNDRLAVPEIIPDDEIWYVMSDGSVYDITRTTQLYGIKPFDREVISNEYYEDHGIIKFDGPVKRINDFTFGNGWGSNMTAIYLPDCVEYIGNGAFCGHRGLTSIKIPENLNAVGDNPFYDCPNLKSFSGSHTSNDGRCLILNDEIVSFAPKNCVDYSTPNDIKTVSIMAFYRCEELQSIKFNEGLEYIGPDAFAECYNLKTVTFSSTLKDLNPYAFRQCTAIEGYYGNDNFHTSDHQCLITIVDNPFLPAEWNGKWIISFAGQGLQEYEIPEGIVVIENYSFSSKKDLKTVSFPNSLAYVAGLAFYDCPNIETVTGCHTSSDHKCIVMNGELQAFIAEYGITSYHIPDEVTKIGYMAFGDCSTLEEITMDDNVSLVDGYAFGFMHNLKTLTLSASLKSFTGYNPILGDSNLERVYMRAPLPPSYSDNQLSEYSNLKIYVPEESYDLYVNSPQWSDYRQYFVAHHYDDLDIEKYKPDYYYSTDYSQNGVVEKLLSATEGMGIDIVLMGDGFSDRQIADGTYRDVMQRMADALFDEEPYKSFKDLFNVYMVYVISPTEGFENGATTLGGFFGGGTYVGGNDAACFNFAQNAISAERMDEALIVVAMNQDTYAGTCYMYYPQDRIGDYGIGTSIAYFPISSDQETFTDLIHHEALGHGFAKLADEYSYEYMGTIPTDAIYDYKSQQNEWGWHKNVDFTSDVSTIRWHNFIQDSRYEQELIGAYEGGLTYWSGVWRPTENSIMRYNTGGFNAPSREAIFYRIHKLAYGDSWTYNYEDFVNYDSTNRTERAISKMKAPKIHNREPLHAPIIVKKSWREANTTNTISNPTIIPAASTIQK